MHQFLSKLEEEVKVLADRESAELLPLLFEKMVQRHGLSFCERHSMLPLRIAAEISLAKAKKKYLGGGVSDIFDIASSHDENITKYAAIKNSTLNTRKIYRSKPCSCWVEKR